MSYLGILTAYSTTPPTASTTGGPTEPPHVSPAGGPIENQTAPQYLKYNKFLIKRISVATSGKLMYSAFVDDRVTLFCCCDLHNTTTSLKFIM